MFCVTTYQCRSQDLILNLRIYLDFVIAHWQENEWSTAVIGDCRPDYDLVGSLTSDNSQSIWIIADTFFQPYSIVLSVKILLNVESALVGKHNVGKFCTIEHPNHLFCSVRLPLALQWSEDPFFFEGFTLSFFLGMLQTLNSLTFRCWVSVETVRSGFLLDIRPGRRSASSFDTIAFLYTARLHESFNGTLQKSLVQL